MTLEELFIRISGDNTQLKASLEGAKGELDKFGEVAMAWGEKLVAALGLFELGKTALEAAEKFEEADLRIARSTGVTGEALHGLEESFRTIYQQTPATAEAITSAMDMIFQRTGKTGDALEEMTLKMLKLAKVSNEDVVAIAPLVTRVFGDWTIAAEKQGKAMDYLRAVSQMTGASVSRLSAEVVASGAPLRQLGYSFEQAALLIGKFEAEGVNTELVLGGMKQAIVKFAKADLPDSAAAWQDFVEKVKNGSLTLKQVADEIGAKRATDLFKGITEGRFEIDKMVESAQKLASVGGASIGSMSAEWTKLKHSIEVALEPLAGPILHVATEAVGGLTKEVQALVFVVKDVTSNGFTPLLASLGAFIKSGGSATAAGIAYAQAHGQIKKATDETKTSTEQATPKVKEHGDAHETAGGKVRKAAVDHKNWQEIAYKSIDLMVQSIRQTLQWGETVRKAHDDLAAGAQKLSAIDWSAALPEAVLRLWTVAVLDSVTAYQNWQRGTEGVTAAHQQLQAALQPTLDLQKQVNATITTQEALDKRATDAEDLYTKAKESGLYTDLDLIKLEKQVLDARVAAGEATDEDIRRLKELNGELDVHVGKVQHTTSVWTQMAREINVTLTRDLSQGITDVILHGKNLGDVFKEVGDRILETILDTIIEKGIKKLLSYLGDVLTNLGGIGSALGGILGTGISVGGSAAGGAVDAAGGAAGAAGGAGGAVGSSIMGTIGAVGSVVSAISGIIGNFQNAKQETTLNAIEHNTRYTMMYIGERADGGLLGVAFKLDEHLQAGYLVKAVEDFRDKWWGTLMGTWEKLDWITQACRDTASGVGNLVTAVQAMGDKSAQVTINITSNSPAQDVVSELKRLGIRAA